MANQVSYRYCNATLNSDTLPEYKKTIEEWSLALDEDADLLLYGCEVTLDGKGSSFVQELSQVTQADVSASVDDTGISGDWELKTAIGEIEATSFFTREIEDAYQHDLADGETSLVKTIGGGSGGGGDDEDVEADDYDSFADVPADDLRGLAEDELNFSEVNPDILATIDFNNIPAEDFKVLKEAGLSLAPLSSE